MNISNLIFCLFIEGEQHLVESCLYQALDCINKGSSCRLYFSHRQQLYSERLTSSYCSTHTFSLSCSPVEDNRRVRTIHSQLQSVATEPQAMPPPSVIGPSFSDIQKEFQRKEMQEAGQQVVSASHGSNMAPFQVNYYFTCGIPHGSI